MKTLTTQRLLRFTLACLLTTLATGCATKQAAPAKPVLLQSQDPMPIFGGGDQPSQLWWA